MAKQSWWHRVWHGLDPEPPPTDQGAPPIARSPTFESAIAKAPDEVESYAAYAEWLKEREDPRGMLIALQATCRSRIDEQHSNGVVRTLEPWRTLDGENAAVARDLVARFPIRLGGDPDPGEHVEWFCGYWRRLRLEIPVLEKATQSMQARLEWVVNHESARFLRTLSVGFPKHRDVVKQLPQLPATVQALHLGAADYRGGDAGEFVFGPITQGLSTRAPGVEHLVLQGGGVNLREQLDLPRLRSLELITQHLPAKTLHAIATSKLPVLDTLVLWLGKTSAEPHEIGALLATPMPNLRELTLVHCENLDDVVAAIVDAPWLPSLRRLDLSSGGLTARGVMLLERARGRLGLEQIDVTGNPLDDDATARVASLVTRSAVELFPRG